MHDLLVRATEDKKVGKLSSYLSALLILKQGRLSKQHLSHWIAEAISQAYVNKNVDMPSVVRTHSTRGITISCIRAKVTITQS